MRATAVDDGVGVTGPGGGGEIHVRVRNVVRWHTRGIQGKDRAEEFLNNTPCINT